MADGNGFIDNTYIKGVNTMFFAQTSGNFTAPRNGVYRITLKGGGGGGGALTSSKNSGAGGGGEGAMATFYAQLVANLNYSFIVGGGGSGGSTLGTYGSQGGGSKFFFQSSQYIIAGGGYGGMPGMGSCLGGAGGKVTEQGSVPTVYKIPGCCGHNGDKGTGTSFLSGGHGGGNGGATAYAINFLDGTNGGGGAGGCKSDENEQNAGSNGGDGYILIEYAG